MRSDRSRLFVIDGVPTPSRQDRVLSDGSRWQVYKRYFEPDLLLQEMRGGDVLLAGRWFVIVRKAASARES